MTGVILGFQESRVSTQGFYYLALRVAAVQGLCGNTL